MSTQQPDGVGFGSRSGSGSGPGSGSRGDYYYACTAVSAMCPVEATTLGYFPNRGINYFFAIVFGLAGLATLAVGTWRRTWSYMAFVTAGCMLEIAGIDNPPFFPSSACCRG